MANRSDKTRRYAVFAALFLLAVIVVTTYFSVHQMSVARGTVEDARPVILGICALGALWGFAGFIGGLRAGAGTHRRVAILCYGFGTALLVYWITTLTA
jgi:hypothetical protein